MYNKNIIFQPVGCCFQRTIIKTRKKENPRRKAQQQLNVKIFLYAN